MSVLSTTIRKGARVRLANGWIATVMDNKVYAHTRMCLVEGICTEMGSVYATDIDIVSSGKAESSAESPAWHKVLHTPAQLKAAERRKMFGF